MANLASPSLEPGVALDDDCWVTCMVTTFQGVTTKRVSSRPALNTHRVSSPQQFLSKSSGIEGCVIYLGTTGRWTFGADPPDPNDTSSVRGRFLLVYCLGSPHEGGRSASTTLGGTFSSPYPMAQSWKGPDDR